MASRRSAASSRNDAAHGIRGFELSLSDGTQLILDAAPQAIPLAVEDAHATATALLRVTRPHEATAGLVTDCSALGCTTKKWTRRAHDFAYHAGDGAPVITPMIRPTTFRWEKAGTH